MGRERSGGQFYRKIRHLWLSTASVDLYLRQLARTVNNVGRKGRRCFRKSRYSVGVASFGRPKPVRTIQFDHSAGSNRSRLSDAGSDRRSVRSKVPQIAPGQKRRVSDTKIRFSRFGECPGTDDALGSETASLPSLNSQETYGFMIAAPLMTQKLKSRSSPIFVGRRPTPVKGCCCLSKEMTRFPLS